MDPLQGEYNVNDLVAPPTGGEGSEEESAKFWTEFIHGVDWTEPLLLSVGAFHLITVIVIWLTRKSTNVQIVIFLMLAAVGFSAERINEYCALNYEDIASQQYFDHHGFFTSMVLCMPILLNLIFLTLIWVYNAGSMLISVKRAELRQQMKSKKAAAAESEGDGGAGGDGEGRRPSTSISTVSGADLIKYAGLAAATYVAAIFLYHLTVGTDPEEQEKRKRKEKRKQHYLPP
eukprot:gene8699-25134_t